MAPVKVVHRSSRPLYRAIVVVLGTALCGVSASAYAQTAKELELEARVAELEKLVRQLVTEKQAATPGAAVAPPVTPAPAPAAVSAADKPIQAKSITPNAAPGTSFLFTGFARGDFLWTNTSDGELPENDASRDYYIPATTPIGGDDEGTDLNMHAKQTRLIFGTDTVLDGGDKVITRVEVDFTGISTGNQRVTNTYAPIVRHAYVQWREWLVGQFWSNFQDQNVLPDTFDLIGPTDGTVFIRQPQARYTNGGLSLSVENPQTTITPFGGGTRIETDDSTYPDLTARYTWRGDWGHFSIAGLARELKYEQAAIDTSTWSGAVSLSGKFNFGKNDIRWMLSGGNLGRYVGLNFNNDAVLDAGGDLESIDGYAGFIAYRHVFNDWLRGNAYFAMQQYDNDTRLTGGAANEMSNSWVVNLIYSPLPKLDIGAEFRHATRELENGNDGSLDRLQIMTKYSF